MERKAVTLPMHAYMLSWKQLEQDRRDAELIETFMATKAAGLRTHARMMLLSGLAGFNRSLNGA